MALVVAAVLQPAAVFSAEDREQEAQRLYVRAAKYLRDAGCDLLPLRASPGLLDALVFKAAIAKVLREPECVAAYMRAAAVHDEIMEMYGETNVAMLVVQEGWIGSRALERLATAESPPYRPRQLATETPRFDLSQLQTLLDKRRATESSPKRQQLAATDTQMTMSEIDSIRAQIARCWSLPAGAKDVPNMRAQVRVYLRPDGSLERPPELVDSFLMSGDEYSRRFAESARRAVQMCSPLQHLPVEKYESWRELVITFDPREMLGG